MTPANILIAAVFLAQLLYFLSRKTASNYAIVLPLLEESLVLLLDTCSLLFTNLVALRVPR